MTRRSRTWAVVLAAGDGTRLAALTRDASGAAVPKQYCSLAGGSSLLQEALARARHIAPRERRCVMVATQHERWWRPALWSLPAANVIEQPANRGTANGILLAVLRVLERDPLARIVFLPSDHFVRDESVMAEALADMSACLGHVRDELLLLGIRPDEADPELGYILPDRVADSAVRRVLQFVEKPEPGRARRLMQDGALWNSFIFGARADTLLGLLRAHLPEAVEDMATALATDARSGVGRAALTALYERTPSVDFSRAVIEQATAQLRVIAAPPCGWSDLGTPRRVIAALGRLPSREAASAHGVPVEMPTVNLADRHARMSFGGWEGRT